MFFYNRILKTNQIAHNPPPRTSENFWVVTYLCKTFTYCGIWNCVGSFVVPDVWKHLSASTFSVEQCTHPKIRLYIPADSNPQQSWQLFIYNQQDATLYNILYYCERSPCFRRFLRPLSWAQKLYTQHPVYVKNYSFFNFGIIGGWRHVSAALPPGMTKYSFHSRSVWS